MELGIIGLPKMGANMSLRLARGAHRVGAYNFSSEKVFALVDNKLKLVAVTSLEEVHAISWGPPGVCDWSVRYHSR